jgi:hypothetical protein
LAIGVDEHWTAAALIDSLYASDECGGLTSRPDADRCGLTSNTLVADVNIVVARGKIETSELP